MIPGAITREDVLAAITTIDRDGVPPGRGATKFDLLHNGKLYPPKYVVALASQIHFGTLLSSHIFGGGQETNRFLAARGFDVKSRNENTTSAGGQSRYLRQRPVPKSSASEGGSAYQHDQRCKDCKIRIEQLLTALYGKVARNFGLGVGSRPDSFRKASAYAGIRRIYDALRARAGCEIVRVDNLPNCDYFVESPGFVFEFDESQHFTLARASALQLYQSQWPVGFNIQQWLSLCDKIHAKDHDPPFRDEQRAWYDTLRDFAPAIRKLHPTVRVYAGEQEWCALDPDSPNDLDTFRHLISDRTDFWDIKFRGPKAPTLGRVVVDGRWRADVPSARRLFEEICDHWPEGTRTACLTTPGAFLWFDWPDAIPEQDDNRVPDSAAYNCLIEHAERVCRSLLDQTMMQRLQRCTDYLTIGIDTKKARISRTDAHIPQPHAELVFTIDLRKGAFYPTGKSYPTTNQQRGLLRNVNLESHFLSINGISTMVLGCHDLMIYHPRSDAKASGWRAEVKTKFKEIATKRKPQWVLHHPHTAVKIGTWKVAWNALRRAIPSITSYVGSGAYSSRDDGWPGRKTRDAVIVSTASADVLDIVVTLGAGSPFLPMASKAIRS